MSTKVIFSIILIAVGALAALLISFTYGMSGGNTTLLLIFLFAAILLIIVGTILAFSRLLDKTINPFVEEIHQDVDDDIQDFKAQHFTNTHCMIVITGMALIVFFFLSFGSIRWKRCGVPYRWLSQRSSECWHWPGLSQIHSGFDAHAIIRQW
jgi:quinol-cytochrome oxidoreductase complex cytochrome b subunit